MRGRRARILFLIVVAIFAASSLQLGAGATDLDAIIERNVKTRGVQLQRVEQAPVIERGGLYGSSSGGGESATPTSVATLVPARIWLHIRHDDQRRFKASLNQTIGTTIPVRQVSRSLEWMPIQHVSAGPSRSEIRFFKDYDRETATVLRRAFAQQGTEVAIHDMTDRYATSTWIEPGHIEVWLSDEAALP